MSGSGSAAQHPDDVDRRHRARQADAVEDLAEQIERQNELLEKLVDVVAYSGGGGR